MNTARADWPSVTIVGPAFTNEPGKYSAPRGNEIAREIQSRRTVSRGAAAYHDQVQRIWCLLASSAASLADNDYITAEQDRRAAFQVMRKLSEMIDDTEREVCLPTDGCADCGSPSAERCECDVPFARTSS